MKLIFAFLASSMASVLQVNAYDSVVAGLDSFQERRLAAPTKETSSRLGVLAGFSWEFEGDSLCVSSMYLNVYEGTTKDQQQGRPKTNSSSDGYFALSLYTDCNSETATRTLVEVDFENPDLTFRGQLNSASFSYQTDAFVVVDACKKFCFSFDDDYFDDSFPDDCYIDCSSNSSTISEEVVPFSIMADFVATEKATGYTDTYTSREDNGNFVREIYSGQQRVSSVALSVAIGDTVIDVPASAYSFAFIKENTRRMSFN